MVGIGRVFLDAEMIIGVNVHVRLDPTISSIMVEVASIQQRLNDQGCIVVRSDRALHGCIESVALWHVNLKSRLTRATHVGSIREEITVRSALQLCTSMTCSSQAW